MTLKHSAEKNKIIKNIVLLQDIFGLSQEWSESVLKNFLQLEFNKKLDKNVRYAIEYQMQITERRKNGIY